mgnify:CR=1 FL=1
MKIIKRIFLFILLVFLLTLVINYPKLNIVSGYAAKNMSTSFFLCDRTEQFTNATDLNFSPINLATTKVNSDEQYATASTFGLLTRRAIYREGLGSVLLTKDIDTQKKQLTPERSFSNDSVAYPFGNAPQKKRVFENINQNQLQKALTAVFKEENETRAVLVIYKNQIIAEQYAKGFTKESRILGWSMTKSVLSTVYGIMQCQGKILVNDRAPISQWKTDERKEITIHNLLQMNSGLEWDEDYNSISDVTRMLFLETDMTTTQQNKPLVGKPGFSWNYSSGVTNLLSGVLRNKLGSQQEYLNYWYRELIDKIGMNSMLIETDMMGHYVASSYAWATPRDWAKLGLLYLHRGSWNGTQIFAPEWVDYITEPSPRSKGTYGAHFWLNANGDLKDVPKNMFYANGYQGQSVYILPNQEMVVVRFGLKDYNRNTFLKEIIKSIN